MIQLITSVHNPRIKHAVRLRNGRERCRQRQILVDGDREILRAHQAGVVLREVFACWPTDDAAGPPWLAILQAAGVDVWRVAPHVFARLAYGERDQGAVAVAEPPRRALAELALGDNPLVVVLAGVEKPGNVGAVVRTADAVGATAVIVADGATDLYNPNAIRASLGTIFAVPVCAAAGHAVLAWLRDNGLQVYAARVEASVPYTRASYRGPTALVLGSESEGLSEIWQDRDITAVSLPMRGAADSLNVSTTAAVLLYEALRQRQS